MAVLLMRIFVNENPPVIYRWVDGTSSFFGSFVPPGQLVGLTHADRLEQLHSTTAVVIQREDCSFASPRSAQDVSPGRQRFLPGRQSIRPASRLPALQMSSVFPGFRS